MSVGLLKTFVDGVVYDEVDVRFMRDKVFGVSIKTQSWDSCKIFWMHPDEIRWLLVQQTTNQR